jgi:putative hemolysin
MIFGRTYDGRMPDGPRPGLLTRTVSPWLLKMLRERLSEDQLRALVAANVHLGGDERRIIDDVWDSGNSLIREVMVPRPDVVFLDLAMEREQAVSVARTQTHSRFPVVDGGSDNVIGFVHLRDLLLSGPDSTLGELVRDIMRLPSSKRVLPALSEMRRERHQLALVVDEYGGTAGIITLEDLIEELVGEIHDEYDDAPEASTYAGLLPREVEGRLNLADFADRAGFTLADGPYETVGGYLMACLGRLPRMGDCVEVVAAGVQLKVLALDGRRVAKVGLSRIADLATVPQQQVVPAGEQRADEGATVPVGAVAVGLEQ